MNRYPVWGYALIALAIAVAFLYTVPNFFGESPAVQVSSAKSTVKVDTALLARVEEALKKASLPYTGAQLDQNSVRIRFADIDTQLRARDTIDRALAPDPANSDYSVALNLVSASPGWLRAIHALPMYLGLDLRGGVHFLLQVDLQAALTKRAENIAAEVRNLLREKSIRHGGVTRDGQVVRVRFRDADMRDKAQVAIANATPDLALAQRDDGQDLILVGTLKPEVLKRIQETALAQNIGTLHKRVNELGVAEPVIQRQGENRIVVQLPGVQDTARAKDILGRTATLEVRLVDEDAMRSGSTVGVDVFPERKRDGSILQIPVKKQVIVTGDQFIGAAATFDSQTQSPAVSVDLDQRGGSAMRITTRENLKKLMAIVLFEKGKGEAISVATIQGEFGSRFQITGAFTTTETNNLALLIRAGALAAPMEIIEERTVGPSLGKDNIEKGFKATMWGFIAIVVFMSIYYVFFGAISSVALGVNVLLLIALLSLIQATLTLPGIAAIALTLGMAIDANVLINERIREELRGGATPQAAIHAGYERAWATIFDSNVTTLIVGISLLMVPGAVRGFAVVHCLGILTSMFSSVVVSRALVNLVYGYRRRLAALSIGNTTWK